MKDVFPSASPAAVSAPACAAQYDSQSAPTDSTKSPFCNASSFRASARFWFTFGFSVIPVLPGTKQTAVSWDPWLQHLSLRQIASHWASHPKHEVGFIVGDCAIVFDADSPKAVNALIEAEGRFGAEPSMIVKTTRGEHHYFLKQSDLPCKTTSKIIGEAHDRIDIKTGRTMVILPPSTGKSLVKFGGQHV